MDRMSTKPSLQERVAASHDVTYAEVVIRKSRSPRDQFWILEVSQCPYCAKVHFHGGGLVSEPPALGPRLSHCLSRSRDYELVAMEEEATT